MIGFFCGLQDKNDLDYPLGKVKREGEKMRNLKTLFLWKWETSMNQHEFAGLYLPLSSVQSLLEI